MLALAACDAPTSVRSYSSSQPAADAALGRLEYRFTTHSRAHGSVMGLGLSSRARGRLTLVPLDDPPLLVGSLELDDLQLSSEHAPLARFGPGQWRFLARRADQAVDATWLPLDMPSEVQSLTRFLLAELAVPGDPRDEREEATPNGLLQARYLVIATPLLRLGLRVRRSQPGADTGAFELAVFGLDIHGLVGVGAGHQTHVDLHEQGRLRSHDTITMVRTHVVTLTDADRADLREAVELLSQAPALPLVELPLSDDDKQAIRRDVEAWTSVRERLLAAGMDSTLLKRAAAHLMVDDALVEELVQLAGARETPAPARTAMRLALGECGSMACQATLVDTLGLDNAAQVDALAGLARVREPSLATIETLLALEGPHADDARATAGVLLSRLAVVDPEAAVDCVERLVAGLDGCSAALDDLFDLFGNAGLPASFPVLRACLDPSVEEARQARALGAMRRIPSPEVTSTVLRVLLDASSPALRAASLRALLARELDDAALSGLRDVDVGRLSAAERDLLRDVLERVEQPGEIVEGLRVELERARANEAAADP